MWLRGLGDRLAVLVDFLPGDDGLLGGVPVVLHGVSVSPVPGLSVRPNLTSLCVLIDGLSVEGLDDEGLLEVLMMEEGVGDDGGEEDDGATDDNDLHGFCLSASAGVWARTEFCKVFCGFLSSFGTDSSRSGSCCSALIN